MEPTRSFYQSGINLQETKDVQNGNNIEEISSVRGRNYKPITEQDNAISPIFIEAVESLYKIRIKDDSLVDYLEELEEWSKKGSEFERREEAVNRIKNFIEDLSKPRYSCNYRNNLILSNFRLTEIPPLDFIADNIRVLDLGSNRLEKLPASVKKLKNLQVIDLSNNKIQNLPEFLGQLEKFKTLHVSENPDLKEIPLSLLDSFNFENLDCRKTRITKSLRDLRLDLRLEKSAARTVIAFNILLGRNTLKLSLQEKIVLTVKDVLSQELPQYLKELEDWEKQGKSTEKRGEAIKNIKYFITDESSYSLDLHNLWLTRRPPLSFLADRIETLLLSYNCFFNPSSDEELRSFNNYFKILENLRYLDLRSCEIQILPESLGGLQKLETLNVSNNPLLKEIPVSLLDSPNFKTLYASNTNFKGSLKNQNDLRKERGEREERICREILEFLFYFNREI